MTPAIKPVATALGRSEGLVLLTFGEALLKGVLEADGELCLLAGPARGGFEQVLRSGADPLLREYSVALLRTLDARRALRVARASADRGKAALAWIPNAELDECVSVLGEWRSRQLRSGVGLIVLLEDDPAGSPITCPRLLAQRLELVSLEVTDLQDLKAAAAQALKLSIDARLPVAIIVHQSILRSAQTVVAYPNSKSPTLGAFLARRRQQTVARLLEPADVLRSARRMELNAFSATPIRGERVPTGFITIGPADRAMQHLVDVLGLHGRVPVLNLRLLLPADESAVIRMIARCQDVVILEPRPGVMEAVVARIAQAMHRRDEFAASVWGRSLPADDAGNSPRLAVNDVLHPSLLVRKIAHLLHKIRPGSRVSSHLEPEPHSLSAPLPPRAEQVGMFAAMHVVRTLFAQTDQWLRTEAPLAEKGIEPTVLLMDSDDSSSAARVARAEVWSHEQFIREGPAAVAQLSREPGPFLLAVCERSTPDHLDIERFAHGLIPSDRVSRVTVTSADLNALDQFQDLVRDRVLDDRLTILIVRDGPPARFDEHTIQFELSEVDRLGYEPVERLNHSVQSACDFLQLPRDTHDPENERELDASIQLSRYVRADGPGLSIRFRPLQEQVSVIRVRPPALNWLNRSAQRLQLPNPIHASQTCWRAHIAAFRGPMPGAAAAMLLHAGRHMGYAVSCASDPHPIGPGLGAWSQVLFTQPSDSPDQPSKTALIPFGEADLILALDAAEAARAVSPDLPLRVASHTHTSAIISLDQPAALDLAPAASADFVFASCLSTQSVGRNFHRESQVRFHTPRLADMVMLGHAFQSGLLPITLEAAESGLRAVEELGSGRAQLAFEYGRHLAAGSVQDARDPARRLPLLADLRRAARLLRCHGFWARRNAAAFRILLADALAQMPGLTETQSGRDALSDFIRAAMRCVLWGGMRYASQFTQVILALYHADRGDRGRALTREAIVPIADLLLIHDSLYTFRMLSSAEHRRRLRDLLDVRRGRGDELSRNILTRIDAAILGRRLRADIRTGAWLVRLVGWGCRFVPTKLRGSPVARQRRQLVLDCAHSAAANANREYDKWLTAFQRLHAQARESRLHDMAVSELSMLISADQPAPSSDPLPVHAPPSALEGGP